MRMLRALLAVASALLPRAHRARWREESLAVLAGVHGARRWWFAIDTVVKVPLLSRQVRQPVPPPGRWPAALSGLGLLGASAAVVIAALNPFSLSEDAAEFLFLLAPCAMVGVVAVRSVHAARAHGGGPLAYLVAALVTAGAGTGPVAAGALSVATDTAMVALIGAFLPGTWLLAVSGTALARRTSPPALAVLGALTGAGLLGVLLGLQLVTHVPAARGPASALTVVSVVLLIPAWTVWSVWTGCRLIRGRPAQRMI
jgi:hypothetical protein